MNFDVERKGPLKKFEKIVIWSHEIIGSGKHVYSPLKIVDLGGEKEMQDTKNSQNTQTLQNISTPQNIQAMQSIQTSHNIQKPPAAIPIHFDKKKSDNRNIAMIPSGQSLLKPIPNQIQIQEQKNAFITSFPSVPSGVSLLKKSVNTDFNKVIKIPRASTTPSGTISTTDTHANRSFVHQKPVSTNDTALHKNSDEIEVLIESHDFVGANNTTSDSNFVISTEDIVELHKTNVNDLNGEKSSIEPTVYVIREAIDSNNSNTVTAVDLLTKLDKQRLREQFNRQNNEIGRNYPSAFKHFQKNSEQAVNLLESSKNPETMADMLAKSNERHVYPAQKRNRAKSAYNDAMIVDDHPPMKMNRAQSNDDVEIINMNDYSENMRKKEPRNNNQSAAGHDSLYRMYKSDCQEVIRNRPSSIIGKNGPLSDAPAPIQLISKNVMQIARQNKAIASLSTIDKAQKLLESIDEKQHLLSRLEGHGAKLSNIQHDDRDRMKRTDNRSKSIGAKTKMHFKISSLTSQGSKAKKGTQEEIRKEIRRELKNNHEQDWQSLPTILSYKPQSDTSSSGKITPIDQFVYKTSRGPSPTSIEQVLSWNTNKTIGQLPQSQCIFQRNEFQVMEMDFLSMSKLQAMRKKYDSKSFPQMEPSMPCGHSESATCFDAHIQRMHTTNPNNTCRINGKKPHQIYSTEYREAFGALVQKKNNNCQEITTNDIKEALKETDLFARTKNPFDWQRYVDYYNKRHKDEARIQLAPPELFVNNSIPSTPNSFAIGQKLEAIDPQNNSLFCVCTIVEKCGYRIKLHFDGYSSVYDFWVNADSSNIFPAGWCSKTGRELEINRRLTNNRPFDWKEYLKQTRTQAAHRACFPKLNTLKTQINPFKIDMKLEAEDVKNTTKICVAHIGDVIDSRVLIKFDGMDSCLDYWADIRSPYIHPINYHKESGFSITSPPGWRMSPFSWESYLRMNRAEEVPKEAFHTRPRIPFEVGMALEVVDKKNPSLIRPAIIKTIDDYYIQVQFIGWPDQYGFWTDDDSCDIFPPGYCKKTGHPIECPLDDYIYELPKGSCGILGCRGIGNAKRPESTHKSLDECPYEQDNWAAYESALRPTRVDRKHNTAFNTGAGPSRKGSVNPAFEKVQISLQPTLNPAELAAMSSKDVEIFRRLQVSARFLLGNQKDLATMRDRWIDRLQPLRPVQIDAAAKNPLNWSTVEVANFVSKLPNSSTLGHAFLDHEIDGLAFLSLRQDDMVDIMGLSIGSAIKVFNRIVALREECNAHYIRYE